MKRSVVLSGVALAFLFVSCVNDRKPAAVSDFDRQRDSLMRVIEAKDSLVQVVFADINIITENLARIKSRENLITVTDSEGGASSR